MIGVSSISSLHRTLFKHNSGHYRPCTGAMKLLVVSLVCVLVSMSVALQCRTDRPSDEELKRVTRSCMRKVGETLSRFHQNQTKSFYSPYNNQDDDEDDSDDRNEDRYRQTNRGQLQGWGRRMRRSANDNKYEPSSSNSRNQQQNQGKGKKSNNQNNNGGGGSNNNNNSSRSDRQSRDMQQDHDHDKACVVHCFFEEMNMVNNDDYPDKYKVIHILTRDIRERELKSFYTDTIRECFSYLEMQRRKDKCHFSKDLITCMTQYARANCDDWDDRTLIFS